MTPTRFDEIVSNLAKRRVQDRIDTFRAEVRHALRKLYGYSCLLNEGPAMRAFAMLVDGCKTLEGDIWHKEGMAVSTELLNRMDVIQQAMLARPDPDGPQETGRRLERKE